MNARAEDPAPLRRGVWLFPGAPAGALVDVVVAAEQLGLDEVWIADEGVSREPVAVLSAAAMKTTHIRLAVGVTSPVLRHPGVIAASLATLDELSGGRAVLGLGVGGDLSLGPFGLTADRPVALLRDAIQTVRDVFGGHESERYQPPSHAIPPRHVPVWVGARGPQLIRVGARYADGLFLSGCTPSRHDQIIEVAETVQSIPVAIYQSAVDQPTTASEQGWDSAGEVLRDAIVRHHPDAIGINLVELARESSPDPIALVERAAALLSDL